MHYSNSPEEINTKIEKLGHTVTNIWNIKQYRTRKKVTDAQVTKKNSYASTKVEREPRTNQPH
jgi:hypothetical protein